jgi:hypothetical protein
MRSVWNDVTYNGDHFVIAMNLTALAFYLIALNWREKKKQRWFVPENSYLLKQNSLLIAIVIISLMKMMMGRALLNQTMPVWVSCVYIVFAVIGVVTILMKPVSIESGTIYGGSPFIRTSDRSYCSVDYDGERKLVDY